MWSTNQEDPSFKRQLTKEEAFTGSFVGQQNPVGSHSASGITACVEGNVEEKQREGTSLPAAKRRKGTRKVSGQFLMGRDSLARPLYSITRKILTSEEGFRTAPRAQQGTTVGRGGRRVFSSLDREDQRSKMGLGK